MILLAHVPCQSLPWPHAAGAEHHPPEVRDLPKERDLRGEMEQWADYISQNSNYLEYIDLILVTSMHGLDLDVFTYSRGFVVGLFVKVCLNYVSIFGNFTVGYLGLIKRLYTAIPQYKIL